VERDDGTIEGEAEAERKEEREGEGEGVDEASDESAAGCEENEADGVSQMVSAISV